MMKIYLRDYDYTETLSTEFPMTIFQIQDILDRLSNSRNDNTVKFMLSQFENLNLPQSMCSREFTADIYRLNLFADRFEKMEPAEKAVFKCLVRAKPDCTFEEMLSMTFGLDSVPVFPCSKYDELGEMVIENEMMPEISDCPDELLELLDRDKIGRLQAEREGGRFEDGYYCVPSCYVQPDVEITIGKPERCVFRILAVSKDGEPTDAQWVSLPCSREKLFELYDMVCCDFESALPMLTKESFGDMHQIGTLNELAEKVIQRDYYSQRMLKAVMSAENVTEISQAIDCIDRLSEYDFHVSVRNESDFGCEFLMRNLPTNFPISVLDGIDLQDFGAKMAEQTDCVLTPYGAVSAAGQELYRAFATEPAEEETESEELEMGGMSL